jgi:hypothetical protein
MTFDYIDIVKQIVLKYVPLEIKKKQEKFFFLNKKVLSLLLNIAPPCRDHLATLQGASIRKLVTLDT